jgi:hypothetical protein
MNMGLDKISRRGEESWQRGRELDVSLVASKSRWQVHFQPLLLLLLLLPLKGTHSE